MKFSQYIESTRKLQYFADKKRHLIVEPFSIKNLHKMADDLNIQRHWFHNNKKHPHYDIPLNRMKDILNDKRVKVISPKEILKKIKSYTSKNI